MIIEFDTKNGEIILAPGGPKFGPYTLLPDVEKAFGPPQKIWAPGTNWKHCWFGRHQVLNETFSVQFSFEGDILKQLSIHLVDIPIADNQEEYALDMFRRHVHILRTNLGKPSEERKGNAAIYRYKWGEITAALDIRALSSSIIFRWF